MLPSLYIFGYFHDVYCNRVCGWFLSFGIIERESVLLIEDPIVFVARKFILNVFCANVLLNYGYFLRLRDLCPLLINLNTYYYMR